MEDYWVRGGESKVDVQNHVQSSVADDDVLCAVDNTREDGGCRGKGSVIAVNKNVDVGALGPLNERSIDSQLYVRPVKVDGSTLGEILKASRDYTWPCVRLESFVDWSK